LVYVYSDLYGKIAIFFTTGMIAVIPVSSIVFSTWIMSRLPKINYGKATRFALLLSLGIDLSGILSIYIFWGPLGFFLFWPGYGGPCLLLWVFLTSVFLLPLFPISRQFGTCIHGSRSREIGQGSFSIATNFLSLDQSFFGFTVLRGNIQF
jgi:hypothetical protein